MVLSWADLIFYKVLRMEKAMRLLKITCAPWQTLLYGCAANGRFSTEPAAMIGTFTQTSDDLIDWVDNRPAEEKGGNQCRPPSSNFVVASF